MKDSAAYLDSLAKSVIWYCGRFDAENIDLHCNDQQKFEIVDLFVRSLGDESGLEPYMEGLSEIIREKLTRNVRGEIDKNGSKANCI